MVTYPSTHGVFEEAIKRDLRDRPRARRPGLHGRRQHERAGRPVPARATSAPTSATSTCTRRSASRTAAAVRAWARSAWRRTSRRSCPATRSSRRGGDAARSAPVSAAPWGSASILLISWMYIAMMGADGLHARDAGRDPQRELHRQAARAALPGALHGRAAAASRTSASSTRGRSRRRAGIEVEDIAKRLMDYGFHAPTMSFPVPGTLMIEPTESESKAELDRFCDAMIAIREEIARDRGGQDAARGQPAQERAAHGGARCSADRVDRTPTPREQAAFPLPWRARRTSSGRRSAASTTSSATASSSAPAPTSANTRSDRRTLTPTLSRKRERERIRSDPLAPRSGERVRVRGLPKLREVARDPASADSSV